MKFAVVITKALENGTKSFKVSSLTEAKAIASKFQHRLLDIMEFNGRNWVSIY